MITEETDEQGHPYVGYGIRAWDKDEAHRKCLMQIPDLFPSKKHCLAFVELCNEEEVASFHLLEVIDNMLAVEYGGI